MALAVGTLAVMAGTDVDASGKERYIAETFCMHSIARLAYKRGAYGYALFED